ncbi:MAG TPA: HepT-like ribonuclease domain-containing protein [Pseudobdellovibrionaceae bacterium]|jgi:uncharacterized protein with HEPN domain
MPRKLEAYVEEILESIAQIESFVRGIEFAEYLQDDRTKAAVERKLLNIGEALNQASQVSQEIETKVTEFRKIVGFRNVLVHGYFGVDDALVWDIIATKLKRLKSDVESL